MRFAVSQLKGGGRAEKVSPVLHQWNVGGLELRSLRQCLVVIVLGRTYSAVFWGKGHNPGCFRVSWRHRELVRVQRCAAV